MAPVAPECILELEDGQGSRLRVELKGAAPAELETLRTALHEFRQRYGGDREAAVALLKVGEKPRSASGHR